MTRNVPAGRACDDDDSARSTNAGINCATNRRSALADDIDWLPTTDDDANADDVISNDNVDGRVRYKV
jgi:hypothetical protein